MQASAPGKRQAFSRHVRKRLADATVPQIATFTGHRRKGAEAILDAHYLGRDVRLAELAVMKLETRTKL